MQVFNLLMSGDWELWQIIFLSLRVSLTAVAIGIIIGVPLGAIMGLYRVPGRVILENIVYTLMGLPPVLVGVIVYLLLSRYGPLGSWQLLFTPTAMILAQVILVTPIITGLTSVAVREKQREFKDTAISLGASPGQVIKAIIVEARAGILVAIVSSFGRAIAEVGAVMLVGGNIANNTRVMTSAIVMETRQGNFNLALSLGLVLLVIAFIVNLGLRVIQREGRDV